MAKPHTFSVPHQPQELLLGDGVWVAPQNSSTNSWSEGELEALSRIAPARRFTKGEHVHHEGDLGEGFFLVLEGRVKLSTLSVGEERILALCGPGDLFSMNRCAGAVTHPVEAVSLSVETRLISVSCGALTTALQTSPSFSARLISVLAGRIGALEEQLEQTRLPVQARLARTLLSLCKRLGFEIVPDIYEVTLELRHDEIASLAGAGRVSVTQALSAWRTMGIVTGTRGRYQVDAARLLVLCELLEMETLN